MKVTIKKEAPVCSRVFGKDLRIGDVVAYQRFIGYDISSAKKYKLAIILDPNYEDLSGSSEQYVRAFDPINKSFLLFFADKLVHKVELTEMVISSPCDCLDDSF